MSTSSATASPDIHKVSFSALLVTIGIVFGDIGTSPLYVMKAIMGANLHAGADYIIGAVSCVILDSHPADHTQIRHHSTPRRQ